MPNIMSGLHSLIVPIFVKSLVVFLTMILMAYIMQNSISYHKIDLFGMIVYPMC